MEVPGSAFILPTPLGKTVRIGQLQVWWVLERLYEEKKKEKNNKEKRTRKLRKNPFRTKTGKERTEGEAALKIVEGRNRKSVKKSISSKDNLRIIEEQVNHSAMCWESGERLFSGGGRKESSRQRGDRLFPAKSFVLLGVSQLCQSYASFLLCFVPENRQNQKEPDTRMVNFRPRIPPFEKFLCVLLCSSNFQSDNGREFSNQVISEICAMWKDVNTVHGKPRHSQTQGSVERINLDIQNMLTA
ncbi:KRAB-A domain-containing protein 2 [Trichonephila clavipes]|nr:KRAB-A domain-containing protein 2 [Trichonephila clavipes]